MKAYASIKELEAERLRLRRAVARQEDRIRQDAEDAWTHTKEEINPINAVKRALGSHLQSTWWLLGLRVAGIILQKKLQGHGR